MNVYQNADDHPQTVELDRNVFLDLLHWSRRYADGRMTGVPSEFNRHYGNLVSDNPWIAEIEPSDSHVCKDFPLAHFGS